MEATPRPWRWWTSCNWRRLSSDVTGKDGDVIRPITSWSDGHPDLIVREADMELIIRAVNAHDALVAVLAEAELQIEYLHEQYKVTGSGNAVLARIRAALALARGDTVNLDPAD